MQIKMGFKKNIINLILNEVYLTMHKKINKPEIFNIDVFEETLDQLYMKFIYAEADIATWKKKIIEMKEWLEHEKDLWHYNG